MAYGDYSERIFQLKAAKNQQNVCEKRETSDIQWAVNKYVNDIICLATMIDLSKSP